MHLLFFRLFFFAHFYGLFFVQRRLFYPPFTVSWFWPFLANTAWPHDAFATFSRHCARSLQILFERRADARGQTLFRSTDL